MSRPDTVLRPVPALASSPAYRVPRHPAPTDLQLDANEGATPPRALLDVAALVPGEARRYPRGARALEARLAREVGVEPARVLVTAGADDALARAIVAVAAPGREVVLPVPTFEMIRRYVALAGARLRAVDWAPGTPWPLESVLAACGPETAAILVVSPNNPTGGAVTAGQLRRLLEEVASRAPQALVIVDQAYAEYADDDLAEATLAADGAVLVRSFSKAWGLAGLRVGWAAGPERVVGWLRGVGQPYAVSSPGAVGALAALEGERSWLERHVDRVRTERSDLVDRLRDLGAEPWPSQANFVLARFPDAAWAADALAGLGVAVRRFPETGAAGDVHLEGCVRITCPAAAPAYDRLARSLAAALRPEALLLDLDGVLADVSGSFRRTIVETARRFGVEVTTAEISAVKAAGDANNDWHVTHRLLAAAGVEVALEDVAERFEALYQGAGDEVGLRANERLLVDPGLLQRLTRRLPLAIVTGRPRADARRFLEEQGIADRVTVLVGMEDGPPKPDPAPVRVALERLGVERAWMVGDTPDDVRAARGAGVVPLGVVAPSEAPGFAEVLLGAGAARVLSNLNELEELLP